MVVRPLKGLIWLAGTVIAMVLPTSAQVLEHPYTTDAVEERTIARFIDNASVRRAYDVLRTLSGQTPTSRDVLPFSRSTIARASGYDEAADRTMDVFIRTRPNSPSIPLAWMERGLAAIEDGDDEAATRYFDEAARTAALAAELRRDSTYRPIAHVARFWNGAALARRGMFGEALEAFRAAIVIDTAGTFADHALYAIGQLHERNRQFDSAIVAFRAVRLSYPKGPVTIAARIREAQNLLVLRRPERALDALYGVDTLVAMAGRADTITLAPQRFAEQAEEQVNLLRTDIAIQRGRYLEAAETAKNFLVRWPRSEFRYHVRLQAGFAALQLGLHEEALGQYTIVVDSITDETSIIRQQALLYGAVSRLRLGDSKQALATLAALSVQDGYPYQAQALVEVGQAAYEAGEYDKAMKQLEKAERISQDAVIMVRAALLLGAAAIEMQNWAKAADAFARAEQRALAADPAFMPLRQAYLAESRLKRGICLVKNGSQRQARVSLTDFLGNHPTDSRRDEATFWLAEAMFREDLLKNAQELYEEVVNRYTASIRREEALYGLAWTFFRRRDFDKSTATFGQLLKAFPTSKYAVEAMARRGDGFYVTRQFRAATEAYTEAARRGPTTDEGQYSAYQAAQAAYKSGDLDEALALARAYVQRYPSSRLADEAFYLVGWVHFERGQFDVAVNDFRKLLDVYPSGDMAPKAMYAIGDALYNMGDIDGSIEAYRALLQRYPAHPFAERAVLTMQETLIAASRTDDAIRVADDYIATNPNSSAAEELVRQKAQIFYSGKNYSSAASELTAYLSRYPSAEKQDEALYLLGKTYLNMNDAQQATAAFHELKKKFPSSTLHAQATLDLAEYYDKSANSSMADSLYRIVQTTFAEDSTFASRAGYSRALMLRARGDTSAAMNVFLAVADRYAGFDYAEQARYQLAMMYGKQRAVDSMKVHLSILAGSQRSPALAAEALYRLARVDMAAKDYMKALPQYEKIRDSYAGFEDWYTLALLDLGECYEQINNLAEAKRTYGVLAALRPDDDYGKTAQARLKRLERRR